MNVTNGTGFNPYLMQKPGGINPQSTEEKPLPAGNQAAQANSGGGADNENGGSTEPGGTGGGGGGTEPP